MTGFYIEHVRQKYLTTGAVVVKKVAGAEAIAARAQPLGKGGNIVSRKKKIQIYNFFVVCLRRKFTAYMPGALIICG